MSQSRQYVAPPAAVAGAAPPSPQRRPSGSTPNPLPVTGTAAESSAAPTVRQDTPRMLRRLTTALVLVGLIFGVVGALGFAGVAYALDRAESNTAQLIRVQKIQTNLLSADATATSAFLVGGLGPPAQRAAYDQAIGSTSTLIAEAADAQPADSAALSALNSDVVAYAVAIEQARANNRQGFPVGSQYLRNASSTLRSDALPILDLLVQANSTRASDAMGSHVGLLFDVVGLLALAALVAGTVWVARRFKRRINPGLVAACALVLVVWAVGLIVLTQVDNRVEGITRGSFSSVNSAAQARIQANNAKSNESLTLIARGSGATFEKSWATSAAAVDTQLSRLAQPDLTSSWSAYKAVHTQIRKADDGGSWDAAVSLATGAGDKTSNALFGRFDSAATRYLDTVSAATSSGLAAPQALLVVFAIITFLAGVGAALLAHSGLAARLREYR